MHESFIWARFGFFLIYSLIPFLVENRNHWAMVADEVKIRDCPKHSLAKLLLPSVATNLVGYVRQPPHDNLDLRALKSTRKLWR